jgi:hypothetical protein
MEALAPVIKAVKTPPVNDDIPIMNARRKITHQSLHDGPNEFKPSLVLKLPESICRLGLKCVDTLLE